MIGLADCNNFFVSCERSIDPSLEGKAVVVLSNNDGCVVARSNESKCLGVRMGQPAFEIRDMLASGQVIALSGNHILYREISLRIHEILRRYAPRTLDYSVDESFLLMDGIPEEVLPVIGEEIRRACMEECHIPVTIGFAATKTLAKIATETGKKAGQSVRVLRDPDQITAILQQMPIGDLWGIGRRLSKRLYSCGIYTVGDFASRPRAWVRGKLGVNGERSWMELHGESCIELSHVDAVLQESISETRTFPEDVYDLELLRARIAIYSAHVSKRLRIMGGEAREIGVFLTTNRFHTEQGIYNPYLTMHFDPPASDAAIISNAAEMLLEKIYRPEFGYKRGGVVLNGIIRAGVASPSLFDESGISIEDRRRSKHLMGVIDSLNAGTSRHIMRLATEIIPGIIGHNDGYSSSFGPPPDLGSKKKRPKG